MENVETKIIKLLVLLVGFLLSGCIHTYPDGDGIDPTLVQVGAEISVDINWDTNIINFTKSQDSSHRLIIEFSRNGNKIGRCEHILSSTEYEAGNVRLIMPFDFHAVSYDVNAWLDCTSTLDNQDTFYNAEDLSFVKRNDNHIAWSEDMACACFSSEVNLQEYKNQWGAKVIVPIMLTTPLARFEIIATDLSQFLNFASEYIKLGETYSVCLSFERRVPQGYNVTKSESSSFLESPEYYFQFPFSDSKIASGAVFVGDDTMELAAKVLVYNSARIIVSKSPTILFPVERGKITIIKGDLLTDYVSNTINVNNIWDGEIIIEL